KGHYTYPMVEHFSIGMVAHFSISIYILFRKREREQDIIVIELRLLHRGNVQQLRKLERHEGEKVIVKEL
ncbi:hypothetical protein, partial [Phocaeicola sp.]|uniref:hypothetical protein n=1 Tax=Phocaeicola sp. TaxID=2773926 RepID=UPI0023C5F0EC